jgi:hypothetical protein
MRWLRYLFDPTVGMDRRLRRLAETSETECGFRVISGDQPGLTRRWRHGRARVTHGVIDFRPGIGMGMRISRPRQPWLRLLVEDATRAQERTAGLAESWSVSSTGRILEVKTPTALLEWVVVPTQRDGLLAQVQPRTVD